MWMTLPFSAPGLFVLVFTIHTTKVTLALNEPYRMVCYYTNWAQYRMEPAKFVPENIDPYMCTHLVYAFANLDADQIKAADKNDEGSKWVKGMFVRFNDIKKLNPQLKTLLAIGGWPVGNAPFRQMASRRQSRSQFIGSVIKFLRAKNFDGLDINWEYPGGHGGQHSGKESFTVFIQELTAAFEEEARSQRLPKLLLTAAVSAEKLIIDAAYDVAILSNYLDFITIATYDLHGPWDTRTGHNSPLFDRQDEKGEERYLNMDWAARYWMRKGADPRKINIGMATYARTFTLSSRRDTSVGALIAGAGKAGYYTREKGLLAFFEVCNKLKTKAKSNWISEQHVPYAVTDDQWIGYDDPTSIKLKSQWLKHNGFGGASIWTLDMDDFQGNACSNGLFPLTSTVAFELNGYRYRPVPPKFMVPTTTTTTTTMAPPTTTVSAWMPPQQQQGFSSNNAHLVQISRLRNKEQIVNNKKFSTLPMPGLLQSNTKLNNRNPNFRRFTSSNLVNDTVRQRQLNTIHNRLATQRTGNLQQRTGIMNSPDPRNSGTLWVEARPPKPSFIEPGPLGPPKGQELRTESQGLRLQEMTDNHGPPPGLSLQSKANPFKQDPFHSPFGQSKSNAKMGGFIETDQLAIRMCQNLPSGIYESPRSCQEYIVCDSLTAYVGVCSSGLQWNNMKNYCDWSLNVECLIPGQNHGSVTNNKQSPDASRGPISQPDARLAATQQIQDKSPDRGLTNSQNRPNF